MLQHWEQAEREAEGQDQQGPKPYPVSLGQDDLVGEDDDDQQGQDDDQQGSKPWLGW